MPYGFLDTLATPSVKAAQAANGSARMYDDPSIDRAFDRFTENEAAFIAARDSFYLASVSASGWPYVQHRGGPAGFLKVLDETRLGFADYRGNRQYITLANLSENDRAYLFLLDPARRQRIKIWGRARVVENDPALVDKLFDKGYKAKPERAILFTIEAWDVNCSAHIVTRFTENEIGEALETVKARIAELETENARLRALVKQQAQQSQQ